LWLVARSLKHGLMTELEAVSRFDLRRKGHGKKVDHAGHA
jgi:hypothetical protein